MKKKIILKYTAVALLFALVAVCLIFADKEWHLYGDFEGSEPGCTDDGIKSKECKICGRTETVVTEALGHEIDGESCSVCGKSDFYTLIKDKTADFSVVYTSVSGGTAKKIADTFVKYLRERGVRVDDAVSDIDYSKVSDKEIIIGNGCRGRSGECAIDARYLGDEGSCVKKVGDKIVIATGANVSLKDVFWSFVSQGLGIEDDDKSVSYADVSASYLYESLTDYVIDSIKIGKLDLSEFTLVVDLDSLGNYDFSNIVNFNSLLYEKAGYWLKSGNINSVDKYEHAFIIKQVEDAGANGFSAYFDGKDFIVECAYMNAFNDTFGEFAESEIFSKGASVALASDYAYEKCVSVVTYEQFGACGDDMLCDYDAIKAAHTYANQGGQSIKCKAAAVYYISPEKFVSAIEIKTDVDFNSAAFIVDDRGSDAYRYRNNALFAVERDKASKVYKESKILEISEGNSKIEAGQTSIGWLSEVLEVESLVRIINSRHKDFIRHGSNQSSGNARTDMIIVNMSGEVSADTPIAFEYDSLTEIEIFRNDDTPITVKNGRFYNICCRAVKETNYKAKYHAYRRGFFIKRANVTIENLLHEMIDEPEFGYSDERAGFIEDGLFNKYGSRCESYPYYGFLYISHAYNLKVNDTILTAHTTYYEDKPATASTGGKVPDPVAMGSYDFVIEYSSHVTFTNVKHPSDTGLGDSRYWGIMSSNGSKNMTFIGCEINRFDAHRGFWNASLIDTTIGHTINLIGGGVFTMDGVTKVVGEILVSLRGDYGATFNGDINIKNSTLLAYKSYNTSRGQSVSTEPYYSSVTLIKSGYSTSNSGYNASDTSGAYWLWDFGYTSYMPRNVVVDNFTTPASKSYLFNDLPDKIFTKSYVDGEAVTKNTVKYPYVITDSVTYKNMKSAIPVCKSSSCTKLRAIEIKLENIG